MQVVSPQAAYIVTDILNGNTNPASTRSGASSRSGDPDGDRRPATLKTGTNNDAKDLNAYGYIAPPTEEGRAAGAYALAVGVWNGNSDNTPVSTPARPVFSIDVSTFVWQGFMQRGQRRVGDHPLRPPGRGPDPGRHRPVHRACSRQPATEGVDEWFIGGQRADVAPGQADTCGIGRAEGAGHESKFPNWMEADRDWMRRAQRGPGDGRRARQDADHVLLQQPVQPRMGGPGAVRGRRRLWRIAEPVAELHPAPDTRRRAA